MMRRVIRALGLSVLSIVFCISAVNSALSQTGISSPETTTMNGTEAARRLQPTMKVAVCLTGQLLRLEVLSKIRNLIAYNAVYMGHKVDVFVLLDNNRTEAKQTYFRYDYSSAIYRNMTTKSLREYFKKNIKEAVIQLGAARSGLQRPEVVSPVSVRVVLAPPLQANYTTLGGRTPVGDKTGPIGEGIPTVGDFETGAVRFQNNMRWLGGLRSCVKWVQHTEHEQKWFYDVVVRLRDDSYLLGPWPITADKYKGAFVTAAITSAFGVNDHNFAVDRRWADPVLRGVSEDYYFNETLDFYTWTNTEHRIYKVLTSKNIPIRMNDVCEQPVAHLRGMINATHWRLHPSYSETMIRWCEEVVATAAPALKAKKIAASSAGYWGMGMGGRKKSKVNKDPPQKPAVEVKAVKPCCLPEWLGALQAGAVTVAL